jgi:hypothetical protein
MRKIRSALLSILTVMSGAILAVPTEAAERYIPGVYKGVPERFLSHPYGGSYRSPPTSSACTCIPTKALKAA